MNNKDLRVIKTKQNIRDTFIQLLSESEFEKITVQDLIDRAKINRSTFYKHYPDKYALAESIASDFLEQYRTILEQHITASSPTNQLLFVDKLYEILVEYRITILALWKVRTEHIHIFDDMQELLKHIAEETFYKVNGKKLSSYQGHILSSLMIANFQFLLENMGTYTRDDILVELRPIIRFLDNISESPRA